MIQALQAMQNVICRLCKNFGLLRVLCRKTIVSLNRIGLYAATWWNVAEVF